MSETCTTKDQEIQQTYARLTEQARQIIARLRQHVLQPLQELLSKVYPTQQACRIVDSILYILGQAIAKVGPTQPLPLGVAQLLNALLSPIIQEHPQLKQYAAQQQQRCLQLCSKCQVAGSIQACAVCVVTSFKYLVYSIMLSHEEDDNMDTQQQF